jgi:hypothetical protein
MSSFLPQSGQPEVHQSAGGRAVDLADLGLGVGRADAEPFNLAEPALPFRLGDAVNEVVRISISRPR